MTEIKVPPYVLIHTFLMKCEEEDCGRETYTCYVLSDYRKVCERCYDKKYNKDKKIKVNGNSRNNKREV